MEIPMHIECDNALVPAGKHEKTDKKKNNLEYMKLTYKEGISENGKEHVTPLWEYLKPRMNAGHVDGEEITEDSIKLGPVMRPRD